MKIIRITKRLSKDRVIAELSIKPEDVIATNKILTCIHPTVVETVGEELKIDCAPGEKFYMLGCDPKPEVKLVIARNLATNIICYLLIDDFEPDTPFGPATQRETK